MSESLVAADHESGTYSNGIRKCVATAERCVDWHHFVIRIPKNRPKALPPAGTATGRIRPLTWGNNKNPETVEPVHELFKSPLRHSRIRQDSGLSGTRKSSLYVRVVVRRIARDGEHRRPAIQTGTPRTTGLHRRVRQCCAPSPVLRPHCSQRDLS